MATRTAQRVTCRLVKSITPGTSCSRQIQRSATRLVKAHPPVPASARSFSLSRCAYDGPTKPDGAGSKPSSKTLGALIAESIKVTGPMPVATFMRTCLLDPSQGYYASANQPDSDVVGRGRDVLGARGDFITSPEISQVFGELLAIYFVSRWQAVGTPDAMRLVELGPGKGTLLADMIRTFSRFPIIHTLKTIHLVETSEGLMKLQLQALEEALKVAGKKIAMPDKETLAPDEVRVEYFPLVDAVPIAPHEWTSVVAHEFFDALPVHIFQRTTQGFREVLVDLIRPSQPQSADEPKKQSGVTTIKVSDLRRNQPTKAPDAESKPGSTSSPASTDAGKPAFQYVLSPTETPWTKLLVSSNPRFQSLQPGQRVEISPESWATARKIGELVAGRKAKVPSGAVEESGMTAERASRTESDRLSSSTRGGAALIVDYGDAKAFGGSFRAFKAHEIVDPLAAPGQADLTANVDFSYLGGALKSTDARPVGPMFQSHFLASLGFEPRVQALVKAAAAREGQTQAGTQTQTQTQTPSSSSAAAIEAAAKRLIDPTGMGAQYKVLGVEGYAHEAGHVFEASRWAGGVPENEREKVYPFDYQKELSQGGRGKEGEEGA